jgi:hypothetical protein
MEVYIDGVKYVPAKEVLINADIFINKLIELWWGKGWENAFSRDELMTDLRVHVHDGDLGGITLKEFYDELSE